MPGEWHPHAATWMAFPHNRDTWPSQLEGVRETFYQLILQLLPHERVQLLVDGFSTEQMVRRRLNASASTRNLSCHKVKTADAWIRDYGPSFLLSKEPDRPGKSYVDWSFDGWGGKYPEQAADDGVNQRLGPALPDNGFSSQFVLEGGSIDVNGEGVCMTTEQCLLRRHPDLGKEGIEEVLKEHLGLEDVLWLGQGIAGDDTDGHIDTLARFVDPDTIVCVQEEDRKDENHEALKDAFQRLKSARRSDGRGFWVVALPMPAPMEGAEGERLPASYANFYIANNVVLMPTFGCSSDTVAQETLQILFKSRRVIGVDCRDLVQGLGAIHCITQQEPASD